MQKPNTTNAFMLLEIVLSIFLVGVAFGIFAYFYFTKQNTPSLPQEIDNTQEEALRELQSIVAPKSYKIIGSNGEFCEGEMFEIQKNQSTFKIFEPKSCDK